MAGRIGKRVYATAAWRRARRAALERDRYRCRACGAMGRLEVHHRNPIVTGADWFRLDNLIVLCRPCHFADHGRVYVERPRQSDGDLAERRRMREWARG